MTKANLDYSHYFWQGKQIRLRALTSDDAGHSFAQSLDSISREEYNIGIELPTSLDEQKAWLEKRGGCKEVNNMIAFAVETHKQEFVGFVNMHSIDERHGKFSFSVIVARQHRKKGYAEEAVRLILKYGFMERRLRKCHSACAGYNTASIELHRKLGFIQEGRLRQDSFYNGAYHDEILFGLLLDEYKATTHKGD